MINAAGRRVNWDPVFANDVASGGGSLRELNAYVSASCGCKLTLEVDESGPWWTTRWMVGATGSRLVIGRLLNGQRQERLQWRNFSIMPMLGEYLRKFPDPPQGEVLINLEDFGLEPGLALCDSREDYFLIPDPDFVHSNGYSAMRNAFASSLRWSERRAVAFWRGADFGPVVSTVEELPRVRLCRIGSEHPDLFDVGIAGIRRGRFTENLRTSDLMRDHVPAARFPEFMVQIDIDGRSNAWTGLYQRLLTGSPVLKVASHTGYRQWYYGALEPWVNYVPVAGDMSDLVEKTRWLFAHKEVAKAIGEQGRDLALSLTYDAEMRRAARTIAAAFRYFS